MSQKLESVIAVIRHRYWQELIPCCRPRRARCYCAAAEVVTCPGRNSLCQYAAVPDRHGSLRRRAYLSRKLNSLGHDARLLPAKYVRPIECLICAVVDFKNAVQAAHGYRNGPSTRSSDRQFTGASQRPQQRRPLKLSRG